MDFFNKITFKNIVKESVLFFVYGIFPLIALLLFYSPLESFLGLLFSYVSLVGVICGIYFLFLIKNKVFALIKILPKKINSIESKNAYPYLPYLIKISALIISIMVLYLTFSFCSLLLNVISIMSVLNPLMIIVLNIYYLIMAFVFEGDFYQRV